MKLLSLAEAKRLTVAKATDRAHKSALGQFMTPAPTAQFMASLLSQPRGPGCLLDPGAGLGALSAAVLDHWHARSKGHRPLSVTAYELDERLRPYLSETLASHSSPDVSIQVHAGDYLAQAAASILRGETPYTHAILNPPYKKIGAGSDARASAQQVGLTVVNLYAAFVGLALAQLKKGGELVAIIPRSFCNGTYYKPFRQWILKHAAIQHVHLFESRTQRFEDDAVLQENLIMLLKRGGTQGDVTITSSDAELVFDEHDKEVVSHQLRKVPFERVVKPNDGDVFFHISMKAAQGTLETAPSIQTRLEDLGIGVSTGPVVSFRTREHLREKPTKKSVPMLYPAHFNSWRIEWPMPGGKRPNAIEVNDDTLRWLYPGGTYVAVRRMSSKEEKKRINAVVVSADDLGEQKFVGLDNGLNVFHSNKQPLDDVMAWGLLAYLSSSALDEHFRRFNGHTQVNATDLRNIPYPSQADLMKLGRWAIKHPDLTQDMIDNQMEQLLEGSTNTMTNEQRIAEALNVLTLLDFPRAQLNDRSALCLLALLDLKPNDPWAESEQPLIGITPIMDWVREHYDRPYAPNTRETFRRQSMHQFVDAGLALYNPDKPTRPVNSPSAVYQISPEARALLRLHGTHAWAQALGEYQQRREGLAKRYAKARDMNKIPVRVPGGATMELSVGEHSQLIADIIQEFGPRFAPGADLIYAGDTGSKMGYFNEGQLHKLGVVVDQHGKMPDVVLYDVNRKWLILIEAVTSHGPVDGKRHDELAKLFAGSKAGLVYVTAFPDRKTMSKYVSTIAWETEVWVADAPAHLVHFNGDRYLGPHK
jgi:adenine-specific DNA-methyltransferase